MKVENPLIQLRKWAEKHPILAANIPTVGMGGFMRKPRTELIAIKKVLIPQGMDIFAKAGYRNIGEMAIDRPGLWIPTKEIRICRNRCVTDDFVEDIVDNLIAETSAFGDYKSHDSGTGTNSENATDSALQTPWGGSRDTGTQIEGASANIYKSVATTTYTGTYAITEHGIFNNTTGGVLMDRTVFSAINVENTNQIEWTFNITFSSGS